jgi:hypothetical protein
MEEGHTPFTRARTRGEETGRTQGPVWALWLNVPTPAGNRTAVGQPTAGHFIDIAILANTTTDWKPYGD